MVQIILFIIFFLHSTISYGGSLPQNTSPKSVETASIGDTLIRQGPILVTKENVSGILRAKIFSSAQWDMTGEPIVKYDTNLNRITSKSRYVSFIPDKSTSLLKVNRTIGNTGVKEEWIIPDSTVTTLVWTIDTNADITWESETGILSFTSFAGLPMFSTLPPVAWDSKNKPVGLVVKYTDRVLTYTISSGNYTYPLIVDPTTVTATNDGFVSGGSDVTYDTGRNLTTGTGVTTTQIQIGQWYAGAYWAFRRGFASFEIPNMTTLTSASFFAYVGAFDITDAFNININVATCGNPLSTADFDAFEGHQVSGAYNGTLITTAISTSSIAQNDWHEFALNAYGLSSILSKKNDTWSLAVLCSSDYLDTEPAEGDDGMLYFYSSVTADKEPYLSITYTIGGGSEPTANKPISNGEPAPMFNSTPVPIWRR